MYAVFKCLRVNNPSSEAVQVQAVQFCRDYNFEEYIDAPEVGQVGVAVLEIPNDTNGIMLMQALYSNPKAFSVVMTNGAHGGWYYGYGAVAGIVDGPSEIISPFDRKIDAADVDHSHGEPCLLRNNQVTFFKSL